MDSGALSDIQLVSSGPGVVQPGENLHLVCKVTGFSITTQNYYWHWIRQPPGMGLEWVAEVYPYDGRKWYAPSLKSRTTISSDTSKNEFSLQLSSLTTADTAVYFCARQSTVRQVHWSYWKNLHLVCKVTGFSITTQYYYWNWIRQPPGKGLEWVAAIYPYGGNKYYAPSLKSRTTISSDTSKNEFSLQLNSLTAADSAVYFCARESTYYAWNWIRQPPGKGLEWVAAIYPYGGNKYYAPSLKSRTTISSDTSKNEFSLQLNSLTAADSAVYFCARESTRKHSVASSIEALYKNRNLILNTYVEHNFYCKGIISL
ncbi:uncharacterized protein LOC128329564 [Hemicordylus capensis]|uniref:uncharacterized protein LOC128329564 n=1 Tax=Hemicordylus capensis TaxID=884348 RepID=UPI002303D864|nr:uncharacterized protein LOC128329564 [Hemicordylus capensis]